MQIRITQIADGRGAYCGSRSLFQLERFVE